jgi:multiple sugar transport system permease protein
MTAQTASRPNQPLAGRTKRRNWQARLLGIPLRTALYLSAIFIAGLSLIPVIWTLSTSLKLPGGATSYPPEWFTQPFYWQNYTSVLSGYGGLLPFKNWLVNTLTICAFNIFGEVFFGAVAGYGFARFRFKLRETFMLAMFANAIVPGMIKMLPQYLMFAHWHWIDTYLPLIIPNWFGGMFLTFLFRQYFLTIPRSLDESAMIDGASRLQIFWSIILPLSRPILATAAVMVYMFNWDNFLGPYIYITTLKKYTLAVGLQFFRQAQYSGDTKQPLLAAYTVIMAAPVVIAFFLFQRYFVQGIQLSASKE